MAITSKKRSFPRCYGSDSIARQTKRLMAALGIEVELSEAFEPRSKGMVERAIGTFQRDLVTCPGFIGHSVADRKVIEARKSFAQRLGTDEKDLFEVSMDLKEFQAWCDTWADTIYAHDQHDGLKGRTPHEVAASYAGETRMIEDPRTLDVLLAPIANGDGTRKVTKAGVRVDGENYLPQGGGDLVGQTVFVRMDPADLGRVMLFDPESDAFIAEAVNWQLAGLNPAEVQAKARAMAKAHADEKMAEINAWKRRMRPRDVADALIRDGEKRAAKAVLSFPKPTTPARTEALDAAKAAVSAPVVQHPTKPANPEIMSALVADLASRQPKRNPAQDRAERIARGTRLQRELDAGREIDPADQAWLDAWHDMPEGRAHLTLHSDVRSG